MTRFPIKVSIITVCYNSATTIERTLNSVKAQQYENIEYIIIDGCSNDGTVEIINKSLEMVDHFVSEKDAGIGDAWNKGVSLATGDIIFILNADDEIYPTSIQDMVENYTQNNMRKAIYYGNTQFVDQNDNELNLHKKKFDSTRLEHGFGFMFTACFFPKMIWNEIGPFSLRYSIAVDTEWLVRAIGHKIEIISSDHVIKMRTGGVSDVRKREAFAQYHEILKTSGYSKVKLQFAWLRHEIVIILMRPFFLKAKTQLVFLVTRIGQLCYNIVPFFSLKKIVARILGISIGRRSYIHSPVRFFSISKISIGNNSVVNRNCYLDNRDRISIGDNVSIAHDVKIYTAGHDVDSPDFAYRKQCVEIDDYAVIFSNAIIQPGVKLGRGSVVMPGAVVTKNVEPMSIVGGNPARHIRFRQDSLSYKLDYGFWFSP